ncbi:Beta-amylase [Hexamita inflata]|uniref:Beta-amylase n=1 Tax=Hexamita inflata TaxID=28002 RepID=A0AA86QPD6_9EUKA|nr:Beta-amylase [Hexamita inflata]
MINLIIALFIKVNVMLPDDTIQNTGQIKDLSQTTALLQQLKTANVNGVMIAVWWGIAEPEPSQYNFDGYLQLFQLASTFGLKVIPIMSFHGSDVVSIPSWALSIAKSHGVLYKDQFGSTQTSYISLSADQIALFPSNTAYKRSPLTIYTDFMTQFAHSAFSFIEQNTIQEIQIGLGPNGELKYPSNSENWRFPGIGAFQSFDDLFVEQLQMKADIFGLKIDFPPLDAGDYNSRPDETEFFQFGFKSAEGKFFTQFYQDKLVQHAVDVIDGARQAFEGLKLSAKIANIHWWYDDESHAAEITAGYNNIIQNGLNAYETIIQALDGVQIEISGLELTNAQFSKFECKSNSENLIQQIIEAARIYGGALGGQNQNSSLQNSEYEQILKQLTSGKGTFTQFTYFGTNDLLNTEQLGNITEFLKQIQKL